MKRKFCLLFVPLLLLSGCAREISAEQAEEVAGDIKNSSLDINTISELKVKYKNSAHLSGTRNRELVDYKNEFTTTYELSTRFNYIHVYSKQSEADKVESTDSYTENESWYYMRKKVLYKATRRKNKGSETKSYTKVEKYSEAIKEFSYQFDLYMKEAYTVARGTEFLDESLIYNYVDSKYETSFKYGAKFYSSGEGNLRVIGAAKCDNYEYEGIPAKVNGTLSCKWDNYLLKNANLSVNINTDDGTSKNDLKNSHTLSKKVSTLIIPTYPRLSSYAEGNSLRY